METPVVYLFWSENISGNSQLETAPRKMYRQRESSKLKQINMTIIILDTWHRDAMKVWKLHFVNTS